MVLEEGGADITEQVNEHLLSGWIKETARTPKIFPITSLCPEDGFGIHSPLREAGLLGEKADLGSVYGNGQGRPGASCHVRQWRGHQGHK